MIIIVSKYLIPKGYTAMAVFPVIVLRKTEYKEDQILLNHEKIHLRQQAELLIFLFYIWYFSEFIIRLFYYKNWRKAYLNISFEKEAYANETNPNYLKNRNLFNFILYY